MARVCLFFVGQLSVTNRESAMVDIGILAQHSMLLPPWCNSKAVCYLLDYGGRTQPKGMLMLWLPVATAPQHCCCSFQPCIDDSDLMTTAWPTNWIGSLDSVANSRLTNCVFHFYASNLPCC
jgi:hypothetical protein